MKPLKAERPESTSLAGLVPAVSMAVLGMSAANLTQAQREQLMAPMPDEWIELLPSGEAYSPHTFIRQRFNNVFGVGQWAIADDSPQTKADHLVVRCTLLVNGRPVASAYGESRYIETNKRHSWGKALESAKSNAIMRCAKDLGVGIKQFWSRRWQFQYRMTHGVLVQVCNYRGELDSQWRHLESPPYEGERGIDPASPNQERYVMPSAARRAAAVGYRDRSETGEAAAAVAELRAQSHALVPSRDGVIDGPARKQLFAALRTHGRTDTELKAFLKTAWNYDSTKSIKRSQFMTVKQWIAEPFDVVSGEVV